jgi:hypothetical protein
MARLSIPVMARLSIPVMAGSPFPSWPGVSPGHLLPHVVEGVPLTGSLWQPDDDAGRYVNLNGA